MQEKKTDFSIIVCSYNGSTRIERCLSSVFDQIFPKDGFEVIVVDDGSTDNTYEIAKKFPVRLIRHEINLGVTASRNDGLMQAQGDFIVCIDDDCTVNPDFLSHLKDKYSDLEVIGVAANLITPASNSIIEKYFEAIYYGIATPKVFSKQTTPLERVLGYYRNAPWKSKKQGYVDNAEIVDVPAACSSYRRDLLAKVGGWDGSLKNAAEDNDLTIRMRKTYPDKRIILAISAEVIHYQNLSFFQTLKRNFTRRESRLRFYRKHKLFPVIFPNPVLMIATVFLLLIVPISYVLLPIFIYPWWLYRTITERKIMYILFPYMQLVQETAANTSLMLSFVERI